MLEKIDSMVEEDKNILADIPSEGEDKSFLEEESTTPVDKTVTEEPAEKGENTLPAEEDGYKERTSKRVQQLLKERAEERERVNALEARLEEMNKSTEEVAIPNRWSELFSTGDPEQDKKAYQVWKTMNEEEKASWKAEVIAELRNEEAKAAEEVEQYTQSYEAQMDELEEEGKTFDRNELLAFVAKRPIFRQDGQPDFATALELMEVSKPKQNIEARKKLATITRQPVTTTPGYKTPSDLKGGWNSI